MEYQIGDFDFIHVFTSLKMTWSKKFKNYLFDNMPFAERFCLVAIDKIHLVEQ